MKERRIIAVEGIVQGVGFRPYVHRLANTLSLTGAVRNDAAGVTIDVEGPTAAIDDLLRALDRLPPPLAVIQGIRTETAPLCGYVAFAIEASRPAEERRTLIAPDHAACDACIAELRDPADRRYRYPFLNCTHCGPRLSIVRDVPYDRANTTMAGFVMCAECHTEYDDPRDRRFHAQPTACPTCGPTLTLSSAEATRYGDAALIAAAAALRAGEIVAIKGLGGYHLACDATRADVVARLRAHKHREAKPLAIMVRDLEEARALCEVGAIEAELLTSTAAPIVLLTKRAGIPLAEDVAPANRRLGVMLPYTPLHHLLVQEVGRPLVMTSGNRTDEPIAFQDDDAHARLAGIADRFLGHDRPIETRCDDSVMAVVRYGPTVLRRSRGFAPRPLHLDAAFPIPTLAVGGHLKNTFCLGKERSAFLSHHIGDLENWAAYEALQQGIAHYQRLFDVRPEVVAHDLHADYLSTQLANSLGEGLERVAVQHHHAHVAAIMAEHGTAGPVLGVAFDGTGLGTDGAIWGGEFLLAEDARYQRVGHLDYVPLPGGEAAIREPWRMALAHLWAAYGSELESLPLPFIRDVDPDQWSGVKQLVERGVRTTPTSSVGRLFDAVAAILGLRLAAQFEAQAAMQLEMHADPAAAPEYPLDVEERGDAYVIHSAPLIRALTGDVMSGRSTAAVAGAFHASLARSIVDVATRVRARTGVGRVALTGGVFQNILLTERTAAELEGHGFDVLMHRQVPCNDGGLSLGQAWVAAMQTVDS